MKDYDQILVPAINMVLDNPRNFGLQKDLSTFPDIAVADKYGKDHIWKGPLYMLLNKEKFIVTGKENYK
jgi:hypothetical protein